MYTKTRVEAAEILGVSTRSIDRYIRAGKLRAKKLGKIIYINEQDIYNIGGSKNSRTHIIITPSDNKDNNKDNAIENNSSSSIVDYNQKTEVIDNNINKDNNIIYKELLDTIKEKDKKIEELSIKLGKAEQVVKNSISLIEYKKSQFLLEQKTENIKNDLEKEVNEQKILLEKEKNINKILLGISFLLLIFAIIMWFSNI